MKGRWTYLYRAVDKQGRTVDFLLSERCDIAAAKRFFHKAMKHQGTPRVITLDAYAASHRAITELKSAGVMPHRVRIRSNSYLNDVVEQDHRRIKHRIRPMLGFKRFETAAITISGIELADKIRNHQFKIGKLPEDPKRLQKLGRLYWPPDLHGILTPESSPSKQFAPDHHDWPVKRVVQDLYAKAATCSSDNAVSQP